MSKTAWSSACPPVPARKGRTPIARYRWAPKPGVPAPTCWRPVKWPNRETANFLLPRMPQLIGIRQIRRVPPAAERRNQIHCRGHSSLLDNDIGPFVAERDGLGRNHVEIGVDPAFVAVQF